MGATPRSVPGGDAPHPGAGAPPPRHAPPGYALGDAVRVRDDWPEARGPVHVRTPHYLRGRRGTVAAFLGAYPDPSDLAFARPAARVPLYHVAFARSAAFPAPDHPSDRGDEVLVELYETWLEPALDET